MIFFFFIVQKTEMCDITSLQFVKSNMILSKDAFKLTLFVEMYGIFSDDYRHIVRIH